MGLRHEHVLEEIKEECLGQCLRFMKYYGLPRRNPMLLLPFDSSSGIEILTLGASGSGLLECTMALLARRISCLKRAAAALVPRWDWASAIVRSRDARAAKKMNLRSSIDGMTKHQNQYFCSRSSTYPSSKWHYRQSKYTLAGFKKA